MIKIVVSIDKNCQIGDETRDKQVLQEEAFRGRVITAPAEIIDFIFFSRVPAVENFLQTRGDGLVVGHPPAEGSGAAQ